MADKNRKNKTALDFDAIENPVSALDEDSSNPDAWVKPEMLKRVSERSFAEIGNDFQASE